MGKSTFCAFSTKFQGQTKLATAIFIVTICFYYCFISDVNDPPSAEQNLLLSTIQEGTGGSVLPINSMALKDGTDNGDLLQVKVIPADLADESLDLLPKESFSHACIIGNGW